MNEVLSAFCCQAFPLFSFCEDKQTDTTVNTSLSKTNQSTNSLHPWTGWKQPPRISLLFQEKSCWGGKFSWMLGAPAACCTGSCADSDQAELDCLSLHYGTTRAWRTTSKLLHVMQGGCITQSLLPPCWTFYQGASNCSLDPDFIHNCFHPLQVFPVTKHKNPNPKPPRRHPVLQTEGNGISPPSQATQPPAFYTKHQLSHVARKKTHLAVWWRAVVLQTKLLFLWTCSFCFLRDVKTATTTEQIQNRRHTNCTNSSHHWSADCSSPS